MEHAFPPINRNRFQRKSMYFFKAPHISGSSPVERTKTKQVAEIRRGLHSQVYATGQKEQEDGKTLVCDKRDRPSTYMYCRDLHLTFMFPGLLQK